MSLETPFKIRRFQRKLYTKAKQEPSYRFYALYDKICREDILEHAYELAKTNGGAPGVDDQSFDGIETAGRGRWLADVRKQLIEQTYQPEPVRRVRIPKPGWRGAAARHPNHKGPGGTDCRQTDNRADF